MQEHNNAFDVNAFGVYTHVVVGAGSAGCIVARRIAENEAFNVLLVEAGPDARLGGSEVIPSTQDIRRVPMKGQTELYDARIDWSVPISIGNGKEMTVPQAKIVGGGSSINGGTALRNTKLDASEWVSLGNEAWCFESVQNAYDELESVDHHPIVCTSSADAGQIQAAFLEGAEVHGLTWVEDLNKAEGAGGSPVCRLGEHRVSAAQTFIDPIRDQSNMTILAGQQIDRVLFEGKRASGVLLSDGRTIAATSEVVVASGAIFSPAILQRSGIGPVDLFSELDIDIIIDLPVGEHLSDHPCIPVVARPKPGAYSEADYSLQMQARWSSAINPGATDLQLVCFSYLYASAPDANSQQRGLGGTSDGHLAGIGCNINKPTSRGVVKINSKDGKEYPTVEPCYLQSDQDIAAAREVVRKAFAVMQSSSMQTVLTTPLGLDDTTVGDDDLLAAYVRDQYCSTYHFCGSCRMASREQGGVVDQSGRVYGVQSLRVCDASVLPTVPAVNTMWPTMMFAHRIGCSIRDGREVEKAR